MTYSEEYNICDECQEVHTGIVCSNRCGFPDSEGITAKEWDLIIKRIKDKLDKE